MISELKCVSTQTVGGGLRECDRCGVDISHKRPQARYCSRECQHSSSAHSAREMNAELKRELRIALANIAFHHLHRDCFFSFDGRYQGPSNKAVSFVVRIKKDKGYRPMPIDVHVETPTAKFNYVTPEDVEWGKRQGRPTQLMPRKHNNFCPNCVDMVVDKASNQVSVTKGVYLPIEHECNSVRVYDLQGTLIEMKCLSVQ